MAPSTRSAMRDVLRMLDRAGVPDEDDHGRPLSAGFRVALLANERDEAKAKAKGKG